MFYGYTLGNYCWDKLYNTEFIRANGLVFDINLKIGEDGDFVNQYVRKCNKVILIDNRSYIHVINKNSVMENLFYGDAYLALFDAIKLSARYLSTSNSSDVKKAIIASMVQGQEHLLRIMCARGINNDIYQEELRLFKKRYMRVVFNTRVKLKQRLKIFIMGCNPFRRYTYYKMYQNMLQDR